MPTLRWAGSLLLATLAQGSTFINPFARWTGSQPPTPSGAEAPPLGTDGLSEEEIRMLLAGRSAIILASHDPSLALEIADGLVDVGARVLIACAEPRLCEKRVTAVNAHAGARGRTAASSTQALEAAKKGRGRRRRAAAPAMVEAGCELRQLDLCDPAGVWHFAEGIEKEGRPLHVLINCADGVFPPLARAACGWERCLGSIHLGPLLLSNLLSDTMVRTMSEDARALEKAEGRGRRKTQKREGASSSTGGLTPEQPLLPFPHPLGRILTVGIGSRRQRGMIEAATTLPSPRYLPLGARALALRANALSALHMASEFRRLALEDGSFIEVSAFYPGGGRLLPRRLRRPFLREPTDMAAFLATTPIRGLTGLFMKNYRSCEVWQGAGQTLSGRRAQALRDVAAAGYSASVALAGAPPMVWEAERIANSLGAKARTRRRPAQIRHAAPQPSTPLPGARGRERGAAEQAGRAGEDPAGAEVSVSDVEDVVRFAATRGIGD